MQEITFTLTLDEANTTLAALGNMPFKEVYELIAKIQTQANAQLTPPMAAKDTPATETRHMEGAALHG